MNQCKCDPSADAKDGGAARVLLDFLIAMSMVELGQVRRLFEPKDLACVLSSVSITIGSMTFCLFAPRDLECANYAAPQTFLHCCTTNLVWLGTGMQTWLLVSFLSLLCRLKSQGAIMKAPEALLTLSATRKSLFSHAEVRKR